MKKFFSLIWGIGIVALSAASCTFAYTQEQQEAYQWAYKFGITTQPTIEAANLDWKVTRQAFAKMVVNYLENAVWVKQTVSNYCSFPDENKITNDLRPYARKTCAYKIMWSDWKSFKPTDPVDRAQLWTVLSRILWWEEYNSNGKWYYIYHLNALKQSGIMNNINNPQAYAKRWDVLVMLKRTYEKFGSNVNMNGSSVTIYSETSTNPSNNVSNNTSIVKKTDDSSSSYTIEYDDNNDYITTLYENSNVIYTWKDWTKYIYDDNFLKLLKTAADKKWESDLSKYLEIEAEYFEKWLDQLESLDLDNLPEMLWIDEDDIDFETMTTKEKEAFIKKLKEWVNKIIKENKDRNDKYVNDLEKVTKKISNDKFWLKDKYKETKSFIDASNSFLDLYSEIIFKLVEIAATSDEEEIDDSEAMGIAFTLMWSTLAYQGVAEEYQSYIEEWAVNTIKLIWLSSIDSNKTSNDSGKSSNDSSKPSNDSSKPSNDSNKSSNSSNNSWIDETTKNWKWDIIMAEDLTDKTKDWRYSTYKKIDKRTLFIDEEYNYIIKIWPEFAGDTMEVYYNDIEEVGSIYIRDNSDNILFQVRINPWDNCKYINFKYWNEYIWWANDERVFTRYSRYKNDWAELITNVKSWKSVDELEKQYNCKAQWY